MKHIIRDSIIFCIQLVGISYAYRWYKKTKGPLVRVIVFHDVPEAAWFEQVLQGLTKRYNVITPEQFHTASFDTKKINVLITFDDGYQTWIDVCLPVLQKYNCKGLFFINSGLLDLAHDSKKVVSYFRNRLLILPKIPLTWEGAQALVADGHTIGGHTVRHPKLTSLNIDAATQEILADKQRIESMLGITLTDFAYPFGRKSDWNEPVQRNVLQAGYPFVYTTEAAFVPPSNRTAIPRICLEKKQPLIKITRWIQGSYDVYFSLKF